MDSATYTLVADGGGFWPGLIVPVVIVMVGLLTAAVVLLVSRESSKTKAPAPVTGTADEPRPDEHVDEPHEDD